MVKQRITLKEQLEKIENNKCSGFVPNVKGFEQFKSLESICAELAKRLDKAPVHNGLEPYCGAELASAMAELCLQLAEFKHGRNAKEEADELYGMLTEYLSGVLPFIRLDTAYSLENELELFMHLFPDPANVEISDEALDELPNEYYDEDFDDEDFDYYEVPDDPYFDGAEEYDPEDGWHDSSVSWLFPDEESYMKYKLAEMDVLSQKAEEEIREMRGEKPNAARNPIFPISNIKNEEYSFIKPLAREYFVAKAISLCAVNEEGILKENNFAFPTRDFSPEERSSMEERSTSEFRKLYGMIASDENLKTAIRFVNRGLKYMEDMIIRRK